MKRLALQWDVVAAMAFGLTYFFIVGWVVRWTATLLIAALH